MSTKRSIEMAQMLPRPQIETDSQDTLVRTGFPTYVGCMQSADALWLFPHKSRGPFVSIENKLIKGFSLHPHEGSFQGNWTPFD